MSNIEHIDRSKNYSAEFSSKSTKNSPVQKILNRMKNLNVEWCENIVNAILLSDFKTKMAIIDNMKPVDEITNIAKDRNKKLRELKLRLKEINLDIKEKERLYIN